MPLHVERWSGKPGGCRSPHDQHAPGLPVQSHGAYHVLNPRAQWGVSCDVLQVYATILPLLQPICNLLAVEPHPVWAVGVVVVVEVPAVPFTSLVVLTSSAILLIELMSVPTSERCSSQRTKYSSASCWLRVAFPLCRVSRWWILASNVWTDKGPTSLVRKPLPSWHHWSIR